MICVRKYIAHVDSFEKTNQVKLERDFYSTSEEPDEISRNANLFLATIFSLFLLCFQCQDTHGKLATLHSSVAAIWLASYLEFLVGSPFLSILRIVVVVVL